MGKKTFGAKLPWNSDYIKTSVNVVNDYKSLTITESDKKKHSICNVCDKGPF